MDENLRKSLEVLKESLNNDERVKKLNLLEEELNNNEEVMALSYKKDVLLTKLNDALNHFKEDSKEVRDIQKELYHAKLELDLHPLVKRYNQAYLEVKKMYQQINEELFGEFNKHKCGEFDD